MSKTHPLATNLAHASSLWETTRELLRIWQSRPPSYVPARLQNDERYWRWSRIVNLATDQFGDRESGELTDLDRQLITLWTRDGQDLDATDAVAWGIDVGAWATFPSSWKATLRVSPSGQHTLQKEELYPVADIPKKLLPDPRMVSSRPAAMSQPAVDELPHVRAHRNAGFEVVFDFNFEEDLEAVGSRLTQCAAVHPNERWEEFRFVRPADQIVFPVEIVDEEEQKRRLLDLVGRSLDVGVQIIVAPELSTTPTIIDAIAGMLDRIGRAHLVVAGSYHTGTGPNAANIAVGLVADSLTRLQQSKIRPFSNELGLKVPWKEGIAVRDPPRLTIYAADRFRFILLVCKDFLDQEIVGAISRLGVNVVCVPAMSEKTSTFASRALQLVADAQAFTIVANGPLTWGSGQVLPAAVFGQPVAGREVVSSPASEESIVAPAISLLRVGAAAGEVV